MTNLCFYPHRSMPIVTVGGHHYARTMASQVLYTSEDPDVLHVFVVTQAPKYISAVFAPVTG